MRKQPKVQTAIKHTVVYRLLSQIAVAATYVLLVRLLSEAEFGIYQLLFAVPPALLAVLSFGITVSLARYLPEYFSSGKFGAANTLLHWAKILRFATSLLLLGSILLFWDSVAPVFKITEYKDEFYIFVFIVVTHFQCQLLNTALSSYLLQQWSFGLVAAFSIAKLIGYVVVSFFEFSVLNVLLIDLAAYCLWYVAQNFIIRQYIPKGGASGGLNRGEWKRVGRFAIYNNFNDVGSVVLNARSDSFFIGAILDPVLVGAYAFCAQLQEMVQKLLPTRFFSPVIKAVIYRLNYVEDADQATRYFAFLVKLNYLGMFPIFVLVAAVPDALINVVFAGKFVEYSYVLVATFAFALVSSFQQPVGIIAEFGEHAEIILASKIFAAYNIVMNLALIPLIGIMGAVIATGSAVFFKTLFIWFFVRKVASFAGMPRFFFLQSILWLLCWLLLRWVNFMTSDIVTLLIALPILGGISVFSIKLADFSAGDLEILRKFGDRRVLRIFGILGIGNKS